MGPGTYLQPQAAGRLLPGFPESRHPVPMHSRSTRIYFPRRKGSSETDALQKLSEDRAKCEVAPLGGGSDES